MFLALLFFKVHGVFVTVFLLYIQGGQKSKPLPNDQKILLNRIIACQ